MNQPTNPAMPAASARKRISHGPVPKPRGIVAGSRPGTRITSQRAEALLMRLVGRLAVDVKEHPRTRASHGHFVLGSLAMLEALGLVQPARLHVIRAACNDIFDGALTLQDVQAMRPDVMSDSAPPDLDYMRVLSHVRAAGRVGPGDDVKLADRLCLMPAKVREMLDRLQDEGVLSAADMFGSRSVNGEVGHG